MRDARAPELSVVVPSVNGWSDLERCLAALGGERGSAELEVIVPERVGAEVRETIATRYPWVVVIAVPSDATIPNMRARAFDATRAPTVAVIEDHVLVPAGWARQMIAARTESARVVGGGLENAATERIVDWAAYFCEYSHLIGRSATGPAASITGNNTAYDRELLVDFRGVIEDGRWEDALHEAFRRRGIALWSRPDIIAKHKKHYTVGEYTSQRFLYARAYAALRLREAGPLRRAVFGLGSLALPPLLFWRVVARVWRSGRNRGELAQSLPLLAVFVSAWAAGELVGSWFGDGGALARVK